MVIGFVDGEVDSLPDATQAGYGAKFFISADKRSVMGKCRSGNQPIRRVAMHK